MFLHTANKDDRQVYSVLSLEPVYLYHALDRIMILIDCFER